MRLLTTLSFCALAAAPAFAADKTKAKPNRQGLAFFESKIRPVLVKHCYQCHSAQAAANGKLKGALRLDTRSGLLKGGDSGPAVIPGKPTQGLLISALRHEDFKMPPKGKLPNRIVADFVKWIKMGAPDPRTANPVASVQMNFEQARSFWSFRALTKVRPPRVRDSAWVRNPIDRFIRARQEAKSIRPNAVADAATLVRRAYFDIVGLPPTPQQIEAFVRSSQDDFNGAYSRLVDGLFKSQHFGEKWARHWLDVSRFAESNGYAFDGDRPNAYQYRDFVIRAFNSDLPYDQFVRLQVAGDLLAGQIKPIAPAAGKVSQLDAYAATGFIVAGPFTTQQTMKERERSRYEQLDDMIHTIGTSMLGLTVGCARCHTHKYDPLPQRDYYRLAAAFADVGFTNISLNLRLAEYNKLKAAFDKQHQPLLQARTKYEKGPLLANLKSFIAEFGKKKPAVTSTIWHHIGPFTKNGNFGQAFATSFVSAQKIDLKQKTGNRSWVKRPTWTDGKVHNTLGGAASAHYLYRQINSSQATAINLSLGSDDAIQVFFNGKQLLSKKVNRGAKPDQEKLSIKLRPGANHLLLKIVNNGGAGGFYYKSSQSPPTAIVNLIKIPQKKWNAKQRKQVVDYYKTTDKMWVALNAKVAASQKKAPKPKLTGVFTAKTKGSTYQFGGNTYKVYFLNRGNVDSKQGQAKPGFLRLLTTAKEEQWLKKSPRVALGDWLCDTDHGAGHLLARVMVNRLWYHYFGRGIVATPSDFGTRGEKPSHPQLLEFLARKLIDGGWKLKPIHRLIVTSATYMQGNQVSPANQKLDPENRLVWRRVPRRLEAEIIRDALLKVTGTLDARFFGKGTLDPNSRRRSVYFTVKRSRLIPLLQLFDAPDTMTGVGKRELSTVAPQALTLLNSPLVRGLAGQFAQQIQTQQKKATTSQWVITAYQSALGRTPSQVEKKAMVQFIERQMKSRPGNKQAVSLALQDFCHLLLCMNEFVYVD